MSKDEAQSESRPAGSTASASSESASQSGKLDRGTYEIIRHRLAEQGDALRQRLQQLNEARRAVFGAIPTELLSTERVTTSNNCIPRDMMPVGDHFLFGYNVQFGLKSETQLADVFSVYEFSDQTFHEQPDDLLSDSAFRNDFRQLYKYYKDTRFAKFHLSPPWVYFVFQIGKTHLDIKAFKWRINGNRLEYIDNRSEFEVRLPPQHDFQWVRASRDYHRKGRHPHVSIEDLVFVETIGGDLTIKVEDNTDSGAGIYTEPVDDADQTLDDAEILYAIVGNLVLLKIRPFKEPDFRYLVFNRKTQSAMRIDSIAQACVLLPESHGLIFANGYYLQTGEYKVFDTDVQNLQFERHIPASNGEDHLFVFYNPFSGEYVLLSYNMIEQRVDTPVMCNGYSLFDNGQLILFRDSQEPQKHHAIQVWQTPYLSASQASAVDKQSMLYKIGNRDIVRGMAECHEILSLLGKDDDYTNLYLDLVQKTTGVLDSYFWLDDSAAFNLADSLKRIRESAKSAIDEFEKVQKIRSNTRKQFLEAKQLTESAIQDAGRRRYESIDDFVTTLAALRGCRGQLISLRELKYIDLDAVKRLEDSVVSTSERVSRYCISFLAEDRALSPYQSRVDKLRSEVPSVKAVAEAKKLDATLTGIAGELEMLIEIISNLKIDDATQRTAIIDTVSTIYSSINQTRAGLKKRTRALQESEGAAEFASQLKLLSQAVLNYLEVCDTPERCDEYLTKLMIQVEELEGRFSEFDDFVLQLTEKRDEIYSAFDGKKLQIIEARGRRAAVLMSAAERILAGVKSRLANFTSIDDINSYFASDLMMEKAREIVKQLEALDESVKVDDLQSRFKTVREDAIRQLRDKQELFVDGKNIVRFGKHHFSVNIQPLDLTTLIKDGELYFHLTGTKFFERVEDEVLTSLKPVWNQELLSENSEVYRAEYLAKLVFDHLISSHGQAAEHPAEPLTSKTLLPMVREFMGPRYREGYVKGVHDHDASMIVESLMKMHRSLGLMRFDPRARALGLLFRTANQSSRFLTGWTEQVRLIGESHRLFGIWSGRGRLVNQMGSQLQAFCQEQELPWISHAADAAECLFDELASESFHAAKPAIDMVQSLLETTRRQNPSIDLANRLKAYPIGERCCVARDWLVAFLTNRREDLPPALIEEAAAVLATSPEQISWTPLVGEPKETLTGLLGEHPRTAGGQYQLEYVEFQTRLQTFQTDTITRYEAFLAAKSKCVAARRASLRLDELKPRVLSSFVRNKLINEIYLPLVGDNLAKQMGAEGEQKRTDLMGLLLLISPPGYGKTTLMEYIASRLGLTFVKINGPAIGHRVLSLDPVEAPNASAREEVEKLNLALEMGDNVMIYLDDIQHCHPEFLQKFISLCDATRRIEGVFRGKSRTYDLRGRKVCVVMAGNPYTESGDKFQIPDMLANRADTYNLGDVVGNASQTFELSYIENAITSNPVLQRLNSGPRTDIYTLMAIASEDQPSSATLEGNFTREEIEEMTAVLRKMIRIREVLLRVNRQYIDSAAQADAYRTEPPFRLQGSYRDMNKLSEKVVPILNDDELEQLIIDHYENQAQTLTTGAEANLLKFRELLGILDGPGAQRWQEIKRTFKRNLTLGAAGGDDMAGQLMGQIATIADGLESIRGAVEGSWSAYQKTQDESAELPLQQLTLAQISEGVKQLGKFNQSLDEIRARLLQNPPQSESSAPQRIHVVNKVPQAFLEIIRYQFETLERWLDPINQLASTLPPAKKLSRSAKKVAENYRHIVEELEKRQATPEEEGDLPSESERETE